MKKMTYTALGLVGALVLTLAACGPKEADPTPTPEDTAPAVSESVSPTETPESSAQPTESAEVLPPEESDNAPETPKPAPSEAPSQTPSQAPSQTPSETPSDAPEAGSKVQAVWDAISTRELPSFDDALDDQILADFYGVNAADLVEYVWKMPFMNTQATEFFIAQVQPGKLDTVKAALEKRQAALAEQWAQYLPDQLELVKNYKLVTNGDYIMFAVTEYADDVVNDFNTYTK